MTFNGTQIDTVSCPAGTFATGGGFEANNVTGTVTVGQSFPIDGNPPTAWEATTFTGAGTLTTYAICNS
jgi:hypothetical protein